MMQPQWIEFNRDDDPIQPRWIIPGLRAGQVGLLTAPGGTGKSFLLLEIAMSVASGTPLIQGLEPGAPGPVTVLNYEDDDLDIRERGNKILRHWQDLDPAENLYVASMSGKVLSLLDMQGQVNDEHVEWLMDRCEGMRLVVLDPLSHLHGADENSAPAMSRLVQVLKGIALETQCGILISHHTAKSATLNGMGDLQQSARGSSALVDASRLVMTLTRPKQSEDGSQDNRNLTLTWAKLNGIAPIEPAKLLRTSHGVLISDPMRMYP